MEDDEVGARFIEVFGLASTESSVGAQLQLFDVGGVLTRGCSAFAAKVTGSDDWFPKRRLRSVKRDSRRMFSLPLARIESGWKER